MRDLIRRLMIGGIAFLFFAIALSACHSYHIDVTVRNNTGGPISLLEVDYPIASFGADALAAGADFHHRIQTRGSAPIKVPGPTRVMCSLSSVRSIAATSGRL